MEILDATVRDGSYAIDFKFSYTDVQSLVKRSAKLGIKYIEIGHGMGLNASSSEHGESLHTDWEYMEAASKVAGDSVLGFFCIPGIARIEDLYHAGKEGVHFIRVGINADKYDEAIPYIREIKKHGMMAMVNFMKSYIITPEELAKASEIVCNEGADCVYIVDSAGCMDTKMISDYAEAIRSRTDIKIGFHGHNNLGLAVSNTIYCVENGFDFVDCTFQGLGRSLGNASLEQTIMILKKKGYEIDMDIPRLLEYGYSGLKSIVGKTLMHPLSLICGYAGFHSGYLKQIYKCSTEKQVDPMRLILAYSELDKGGMDYELLCDVAERLPRDEDPNPYHFKEYFSVGYSE